MAAWIAAGSAVVGDVVSSMGQSSTNAASAQQADLNRQFQAEQQQQVENWETQMSDTAMQRRVQDLNAAGLNPLLAVSQGGASQPSVSPATGSMPSFANPSSAFGNLGGQISGAEALGAQVSNTNADTTLKLAQAKTEAERPPNVQAGTTMNIASAGQADAQTQLAQKQMSEIDARITNLETQTKGQQIDQQTQAQLNQVKLALQNVQLNLQQLGVPKATLEAKAANAGLALTNPTAPNNPLAPAGDWLGQKLGDATDSLRTWWQGLKDAHNANSAVKW